MTRDQERIPMLDTRFRESYGARAILHAVEPRGTTPLRRVDARGEAESADRSAWFRLEIQLYPGTDRIRAASFCAAGPPALVAAGSVMTRLLEGLSLREARHVSATHLEALLGGVPSHRRPLLQVAVNGLADAVARPRSRSRCQLPRKGGPLAVPIPELRPLRKACGTH